MKKEAWNAVSHTVAATRQNDRVKQQQVYRLIEALKKTDDVMFKKLIDMGVSPDTPLYLEGDISSPMAKDLFLDVPRPRHSKWILSHLLVFLRYLTTWDPWKNWLNQEPICHFLDFMVVTLFGYR